MTPRPSSQRLSRDALSRHLIRRGLDLSTFAKRAGISDATISRVMAGKAVSVSTIDRIAAALNAIEEHPLIDDLLEDDEGG
jgi:predicted transcriptional regulator